MHPLLVLTVALFALFLIALWLDVRWRREGAFPFVSFVSGYYFLFHGLLSLYAASFVRHLPYGRDMSFPAVLFITLFVALQLAGYWLGMRTVRPGARNDRTAEWVDPVIVVSWGAMALTFLFFAFPQMNSLPSLPQLRQPSWYFAFAAMTFLTLQGRLSRLHSAMFVVAVALKFVLDMRGGAITPLVYIGVIFVSAAFLLRRHRLAALTVVLCAVIIMSYGYVKYFSRVIVSSESVYSFYIKPNLSRDSIAVSVGAMARRSSHALLTSEIMRKTPSVVPFSDRDPFLDALVNHVPRVFWPGKQREDKGNSFGKAYGILDPADGETSWNLCWTVDFYITGGWFRSLLNIFLVGFLLAVAVRLLSCMPDRVFGFGLYSATVFPLFYQESNFSLMAGSLGWSAGFLWVFYKLAIWGLRQMGRGRLPPDKAGPPNP